MVCKKQFYHTETKVYLAAWVLAVLYAIYYFLRTSQQYFYHYQDSYEDFTSGWLILNSRKKDKADFEWETIMFFLRSFYPFMVLYLVVSEITRYLHIAIKYQQYFQIVFPIFYLTHHMGYKITIITIIQPIIFGSACTFNSKLLIWSCNLVSLALIAIYKQMNTNDQFLRSLEINHFEAYLGILLLCWLNLKCTSFCLNTTSNCVLLDFLAYCFYFPNLFTGPFIPYEDFRKVYNIKNFESLDARLKRFGWNIFRCAFWIVFTNFCLHFVYINATSFQIELVQKLDLCPLCGYGYLMGQFFHIKYVVLYGLSTTLVSFENIPVPSLPRCIGRVHLYSDMWKYFDPGLHKFLTMCIFIPSRNCGMNKVLSSFLCFFFVYIWHGIENYILIWAALNFLGIMLETLFNTVYERRLKDIGFIKTVGENNLRRIKCVMTAPLLAMSSVSNFYFFAGKEIGDMFVQKFVIESYVNKMVVLFMLYCCCNVSTELRDINAHRM